MTAALVGAGVARDADELRLGLRGQVRRVLAPRGVTVVQRLQLTYQWAYLLLAVDPRAGTLRWRWLECCRAGPLRDALAAWAPDAVVWDGHGAHTAKLLADLPIAHPPAALQPGAEPGRSKTKLPQGRCVARTNTLAVSSSCTLAIRWPGERCPSSAGTGNTASGCG